MYFFKKLLIFITAFICCTNTEKNYHNSQLYYVRAGGTLQEYAEKNSKVIFYLNDNHKLVVIGENHPASLCNFNKMYKVKVINRKPTIEGWTHAIHLLNKNSNSPIFNSISFSVKDIIGRWVFFATEHCCNASIDFDMNNIFIFTGWETNDFKTKGIWKYDVQNKLLTLHFNQNEKLLARNFKGFKSYIEEYRNRSAVKVDLRNSEVTFKLINLTIDFFGYYFHKECKYD